MKKLYIAQVEVKKEEIERFLKMTLMNIEETKKEPNCLVYEIYQNPYKVTEFLLSEEFMDDQSLLESLETTHFQKYINSVRSLLTKDFVIQVF